MTETTSAPPLSPDRLEALPTMSQLREVVGADAFAKDTTRSLRYAAMSLGLTIATAVLAMWLLPMNIWWTPAWVIYALVAGTFACGVWVIAHECGHGAFSDNSVLQDTVGFVLHSSLLVPYFSWQRSHAVHHAKTNHLDEGETHVPNRASSAQGQRSLKARSRFGATAYAVWTITTRLLFGWPLYLVAGLTGGPSRGRTNHFWPYAPFSSSLFPRRWHAKVLASTAGVITTLVALGLWAYAAGSIWPVIALYVGPYLVCNAWLVTYTWLQHTDEAVPHFEQDQWSYVRGAFCSIDRPYGQLFDLLHHRIGTTHVAHHLFPTIPHYRAEAATQALANAYPELYRYDPTPLPRALWSAARDCVAVEQDAGDAWRFSAR